MKKAVWLGVCGFTAIGLVWWSMSSRILDAEPTGQAMVDVSVPALEGLAAQGAAIFTDNCSACHGQNAAGRDGFGPPLVHKIYEPSHHGDASFYLAMTQGVRAHHWPFGNMPPIAGMGEPEAVAIIAYVRTLQRANGIN